MRPAPLVLASSALACAVLALSGCSSNASSTGEAVSVVSSDTACTVGVATLPAGTHTFSITNTGAKTTEVYVYGSGDRIVSEKEGIGPGTTVKMTAKLSAGAYEIACKPGETGKGIRSALTVTGS